MIKEILNKLKKKIEKKKENSWNITTSWLMDVNWKFLIKLLRKINKREFMTIAAR